MRDTLQDIHKKMEDEIDRMRLTVHLHANEFIQVNAYLRALGRKEGSDGTYATIGAWGFSIRGLVIQVHLEQHETFSDAAPIIEFLLSRGWTQVSQSDDANWGGGSIVGNRDIKFAKPSPGPLYWTDGHLKSERTINATVRIWPHANSQHCRRVQVGVEPTYKLVCE